jgi:cyclase
VTATQGRRRRIRVVPTLLLNASGGLVKTVGFQDRTYIGDPINTVRIFNAKGVDELILLDIDASRDDQPAKIDLIRDIVSEAFMPVGYGGGIKSVDQMVELFRCGVEKVILSTAAVEDPDIIPAASARFGSQSVVACLDVKRRLFSGYGVTSRGGESRHEGTPEAWAKRLCDQGAGEVIVYNIDRDGSYRGYDLKLMRRIVSAIDVPVVACGGASSREDLVAAVDCGCSAVAAGSLFVYQSRGKGILISYTDPVFAH